MKITESSLKAIIKECLKEVLSEMVIQEQTNKTSIQQKNPIISLIAAGAAKGNQEQISLYEGILTDAVLNNRESDVIPMDALNQLKQQQKQNSPSNNELPQANNSSKYPNRWAELAFSNNTSELTGLLAGKMSD